MSSLSRSRSPSRRRWPACAKKSAPEPPAGNPTPPTESTRVNRPLPRASDSALRGSGFAYRDGDLHAESIALDRIAKAVGTPFYCYSSGALEAQYLRFANAFADQHVTTFYALKANPNLAVIRTFARLGAGADVVSEGELRRALAAGVPPSRIVFSGVGKTREELAYCPLLCHPPNQRRIGAGARALERGRRRHGDTRPHHLAGQSGRRRAHPRQDLHRQEGEQIRHRSRQHHRRRKTRREPAGHRLSRACHP